MMWPPDITKIPEVLAKIFREVFARIDQNRPIDGLGVKCEDGRGGRIINAQPGGIGGTSTGLHPLQVVNAVDEDEDPAIRIVYGTVEGLSDPFNPGDSPIYTISPANEDKIWIQLNVSYDSGTGVWTSNSLTFGFGATVPASTSTEANYEIGSVSAEGIAASSTIGSMGHVRCGDDVVWGDQWWSA